MNGISALYLRKIDDYEENSRFFGQWRAFLNLLTACMTDICAGDRKPTEK